MEENYTIGLDGGSTYIKAALLKGHEVVDTQVRSTGISIADIRNYLALCAQGDSTLEERYQIILAQKKRAEEERAEIDKKLEVLSRKVAIYEEKLGK